MAGRLKAQFERIVQGEDDLPFDPLGREEVRLSNVRLATIEPDPHQPRKDLGDLEGLMASILEHGVHQGVIDSPLDKVRFRLVAGERRYRAALALQLPTVPAIIRTVEDHQRLELQIVENLHRKDLNPFEEATGYRRLMDEFTLTQEQVAKRVGKSVASINQVLRLLDLPRAIQDKFQTSEKADALAPDVQTSRKISKSVLLEIAKQPEEARQVALWEQASRGQLTVKKARAAKPGQDKRGGEERAATPVPGAPSAAPSVARYPLQTPIATVTVVFSKPSATPQEICEALQYALDMVEQERASDVE